MAHYTCTLLQDITQAVKRQKYFLRPILLTLILEFWSLASAITPGFDKMIV